MVRHRIALRLPDMKEFIAPLPLVTVAVMGLNDQYLKWNHPSFLTGKLSDVTGCFILPLFVSALLACVTGWPLRVRLWTGAWITLLFFGAMKVSQPVADWVCDAMTWTGRGIGVSCWRIIADPWDLIAVPFIFASVAWGVWHVERRT